MKKGFNYKKVIALIIVLLIIILIVFVFLRIMNIYRSNNIFAIESEKYAKEVNNPVFKIEKVLVYSDANIEDLSEKGNLSNINISQFTDFAVYIDNKSKIKDLTEENTINKIYIDNISVTAAPIGDQKISFKSIDELCKYTKIEQSYNRIDYNVSHTNSEKVSNTNENTFYTDCSEPLILTYVNEDIVKNKDVSNSQERIALDGSILDYLNIDLDSLNYNISFTINIENNLGEKYFVNYSQNVNLNSADGGIYTGYIMQIFDLVGFDYRFNKI